MLATLTSRMPRPAAIARNYWGAIASLALTLTAGAALAGSLLGFSFADLALRSAAVVLAHIAALVVLLWPSVWVALRRLHDRQTPGWLCAVVYVATVFVFMLAYFGLPIELDAVPASLTAAPSLLLAIVAAWLIVELGIGRQATGELSPTVAATPLTAPAP